MPARAKHFFLKKKLMDTDKSGDCWGEAGGRSEGGDGGVTGDGRRLDLGR